MARSIDYDKSEYFYLYLEITENFIRSVAKRSLPAFKKDRWHRQELFHTGNHGLNTLTNAECLTPIQVNSFFDNLNGNGNITTKFSAMISYFMSNRMIS